MTNREIQLAWERAEAMAERILTAYFFKIGIEQAKKDQKSLAVWLGIVRDSGYVYNGCYDEYLLLKL